MRITKLGALLLFTPTAAWAADSDTICADRPGLATPPCTVPAGVVQIETGVVDWTGDHGASGRSDDLLIGQTAVKLGLSQNLDVGFAFVPYQRARVRDASSITTSSGPGDLEVAAKYRLTASDKAFQIAVRPFLKVPTARQPIGNGQFEGGVVVPIEYDLPGSALSIGLSPELDLTANEDDNGHHLAMAQVIALSVAMSPRLNATVELFGSWDWERRETAHQYALGSSVSYVMARNVQIDGGIVLGLNRFTSDVELYSGFAFRF